MMDAPRTGPMPLCQIALSTTHLLRTHQWYRRALGFNAAGRVRRIDNPQHAAISDLPELALDVWCLVGGEPGVQFEMIEFRRPRMRPQPVDWTPRDIGYSTIAITVSQFDLALERLMRASGRPLTPPVGIAGARRVCLRDPDGVLLELMEDDPLGGTAGSSDGVAPKVRAVTVSVYDIERARRFWTEAMGFEEMKGLVVHGLEHEALWGARAGRRDTVVVRTGSVLLELVQYAEPAGRWRPAGYLVSDQGILNVAFGSVHRSMFDAMVDRLRSHGYRPNTAPWTLKDVATVVYFTDDQGFSLELLHVYPESLAEMGFVATSELHT